MSQRKFVKDRSSNKKARSAALEAQLAAAKAARAAQRASFGPSQMDFEMAVKAAVMKEKSKDAGYVDLAVATYALNTTGSITLVATIAQGVSVNQRVGKKAVLKSLQMRGVVQADTTSTVPSGALILVYDRKPTNALPAITDVLVSASSYAFLNDVNSDRFQIVRRWNYAFIGNITTPATGQEQFLVDEFVDLKKRAIEFNAAGTGAIGDIAKGALYLISVGNTAAGTADANAVVGFRTRFIDVEG